MYRSAPASVGPRGSTALVAVGRDLLWASSRQGVGRGGPVSQCPTTSSARSTRRCAPLLRRRQRTVAAPRRPPARHRLRHRCRRRCGVGGERWPARLTVRSGATVRGRGRRRSGGRRGARRWERVAADAVVLCAGAIGSAALLRSGVEVAGLGAVRQHVGRVIELVLRPHVAWDPAALATGVGLRRGAAEVLALNHLGPGVAGHGALLAGWLAGTRRGSITVAEDPARPPDVDFGALAGTPDAAGLALAEAIAAELLDHPSFRALVAEHRRSRAVGLLPPGRRVRACRARRRWPGRRSRAAVRRRRRSVARSARRVDHVHAVIAGPAIRGRSTRWGTASAASGLRRRGRRCRRRALGAAAGPSAAPRTPSRSGHTWRR